MSAATLSGGVHGRGSWPVFGPLIARFASAARSARHRERWGALRMGRRSHESHKTRNVRLTGWFTPGEPLDRRRTETITIPIDIADEDDELYRVVDRGIPALNIRPDDILVVEPRPEGNVATSELVLVEYEGHAHAGRWWAKRGYRAVVDEERAPIVEGRGIRVVGAITLIVRLGHSR
jgi:hypothetical protein